jgi:hypothetical protein
LEDIAMMLDRKKNYVSGVIHEINKISGDYLIRPTTFFPTEKEGQPGRPFSYYYLNQRDFVTITETAFILLNLSSFPQEAVGRISREKYVRHLTDNFGFDEEFVQGRISWAIEKEYLYADKSNDFIWPHERLSCERGYLNLLAQHSINEGGINA